MNAEFARQPSGKALGAKELTAILGRLLHHATTLNIKGESFRLNEKCKAGLVTRAVETTQAEN